MEESKKFIENNFALFAVKKIELNTQKPKQMKIVFLGAGNLACHLSVALQNAGHDIVQVYSRTLKSANELANKLNCKATNDIFNIIETADLYIVAVSDDAIKSIIGKLNISNKNIVHTAGSIPMNILQPATNYGVFYPLQTFSKNSALDFAEIPICVESNNANFQKTLLDLAKQISGSVWQISSEKRKYLHLAAVFVCNFVNHLYSLTEELIGDKNIDFKILHPLIKETVNKAVAIPPKLAQTGPALRNDKKTLEKHTNLLISQPDLRKIYQIISDSIQKFHNSKK